MRARVASAHPSQELAVVDDEVGVRELVRVEQERRDTETDDGDPEVDQVRDKDRQRDVQQEDQRSEAEVDRRTGESRACLSAQPLQTRSGRLTREC